MKFKWNDAVLIGALHIFGALIVLIYNDFGNLWGFLFSIFSAFISVALYIIININRYEADEKKIKRKPTKRWRW